MNIVAGALLAAGVWTGGVANAVPPVTGVTNGQAYSVEQSSTAGATPDGTGKWTLGVLTIAGGDPAVRNAFNQAVNTSANGQLASVKTDANPDGTWSFDTDPTLYFSAASVSELIGGLFVAVPSAHPVNYVSTVVIDSRNAKPITLADLFVDEQAGLDRLSEQTKLLLPDVMGTGPGPMDDEPGNAPVEKNFANWIPTPKGMEIHFEDYQFVHGMVVLTVPWAALDDVLNPEMRALRQE